MSLHLVGPWEDLTQADGRYMAATTIEEAEKADAKWFAAADVDTRARWLKAEYPGPGALPDPDPGLHLL